jgi:DNA-binding XRE family transcriptional regulator
MGGVMTAIVPRLCAGCGVPLSRYNRQSVCGACAHSTRLLTMPEIEAASPGLVVRAARIRRGWTLTMLASRAGYSTAYLSHIENGQRPLSSLRTVLALATALGVPPARLAPQLSVDSDACPWCGATATSPPRRTNAGT